MKKILLILFINLFFSISVSAEETLQDNNTVMTKIKTYQMLNNNDAVMLAPKQKNENNTTHMLNKNLIQFRNENKQKDTKIKKQQQQKQTIQVPAVVENKPDITVEEINDFVVIKIDTKELKGEFKPNYQVHLKTSKEVYDETNARLVVNAGFFDPKNEQTVSYLVQDGVVILDPHRNKNLMANEHLKRYMDKILNRSEFRVLKSKEDKSLKYDIAPHNDEIPDGYELVHSIQGGPALIPDLRLEEEFFVLKDSEGKIINQSASTLAKHARTMIAIKDNNIYIILATTKHPVSLVEASQILKEYNFDKAMAFDGGGSTQLDFRDKDLHIISDKDTEGQQLGRRVKSFWIVTENHNE